MDPVPLPLTTEPFVPEPEHFQFLGALLNPETYKNLKRLPHFSEALVTLGWKRGWYSSLADEAKAWIAHHMEEFCKEHIPVLWKMVLDMAMDHDIKPADRLRAMRLAFERLDPAFGRKTAQTTSSPAIQINQVVLEAEQDFNDYLPQKAQFRTAQVVSSGALAHKDGG